MNHLWLQQAVAEGRFRLVKVAGTANPADALTKYKGFAEMRSLLGAVNVKLVGKGHGGKEENGDPSEIGWIRLGRGGRWADAGEE